MPRKYASKKTRSSKPSMAKAKRMVTKQHKAKAKKNMDTYFLKTKNTVTVTPSQGVAVSNYFYQAYTLDPGNTGGTALYLQNAEFLLWKLQYDKFRVNSVKITVVPKANVLDQATHGSDSVLNSSGDGLVHTAIDRDGLAPSSKAIITRYPSYRKYSVLKPFSRSYAIKYPTGIWADCDNIGAFSMAKELGLTGGITLYAENILEENSEVFNEPWATITVEYSIVFQGKTSNSLSGVYQDGELVGVTISKVDPTVMLELSPQANVSGTLSSDTRTQDDQTQIAITDLGVPTE